jgi:hypothetical protein
MRLLLCRRVVLQSGRHRKMAVHPAWWWSVLLPDVVPGSIFAHARQLLFSLPSIRSCASGDALGCCGTFSGPLTVERRSSDATVATERNVQDVGARIDSVRQLDITVSASTDSVELVARGPHAVQLSRVRSAPSVAPGTERSCGLTARTISRWNPDVGRPVLTFAYVKHAPLPQATASGAGKLIRHARLV